jgi:elongator complex protein 3
MNLANKIIITAVEKKVAEAADFLSSKQSLASSVKATQPTHQVLLKAYHNLVKNKKIIAWPPLEKMLKTREVRTLSGVAIITVLTKPAGCPGRCVYCPNDPTMPKSYLPKEPAAARALALKFNPYTQVKRRIEILERNGHKTDKLELIVKGGTWSAYPKKYQKWFIARCFEAANGRNKTIKQQKNKKAKGLELVQKINESAEHRIIGLTLETRPDFITSEEIVQLRRLGCTRIELGVQTVDDKILAKTRRGHTAEDAARATALLRDAGFKVDYHLMPALPGSTPKKDLESFAKIFSDSRYRPDMIKIYPCSVIPGTELYNWWKAGKYKPYSTKQLLNLIIKMKTLVPPYVRISRIIRDIPGDDIAAGSLVTSLRQNIQKEMKARGLKCRCIRCREIGRQKLSITNDELRIKNEQKLFITKYKASEGTEYFLSIEDPQRDVLFAFCRLRLPETSPDFLPELNSSALIRELHTYGHLVPIDEKSAGASQHIGFGRQLMQEAEKIAHQNGYEKIAVISGIGVRAYYKKLGYRQNGTYMVKNI